LHYLNVRFQKRNAIFYVHEIRRKTKSRNRNYTAGNFVIYNPTLFSQFDGLDM